MQFLTIPNVLVVLLEYIDLFNLRGSMKETFGSGYPALYHSILLYFILSIAIVTYINMYNSYMHCIYIAM